MNAANRISKEIPLHTFTRENGVKYWTWGRRLKFAKYFSNSTPKLLKYSRESFDVDDCSTIGNRGYTRVLNNGRYAADKKLGEDIVESSRSHGEKFQVSADSSD